MKVIVTSNDRRPAREDLADKMADILSLLEKRHSTETCDRMSSLADILAANTPLYYLAPPTAEQLADWVETLYQFIESRREPLSVKLLPFPGRGGSLLLTNCADAPFLVHTIQLCLNRRHIHFRVVTHPIFRVGRSDGELTALCSVEGKGDTESLVVIELEIAPANIMQGLEDEISEALSDVLTVAASREAINDQLRFLSGCDQCSEFSDFFNWLAEGNISLFAYRCLRIGPETADGKRLVRPEPDKLLGLVEKLFLNYESQELDLTAFDPRFQELLLRKEKAGIEVLDRVSPILRGDRLIYIGARQELEDGTWLEHGFIGLSSENALSGQALSIPVLRRKIDDAIDVLGIPSGSHDHRKVIEILNSYPPIELFFMDREEIVKAIRSFALMYRHGMVRVIPARGLAIRGVTLLLIMPRSFYSDDNIKRIESFLCRYFKVDEVLSRVIHLSADYLTLHVNLQPQGDEIIIDIDRLERSLTHIAQTWGHKLHHLIERDLGEEVGGRLWESYQHAFSADYKALMHPRFAVRDIRNIEELCRTGEEVVDLWGPFGGEEEYRLQFYSLQETYLNELMPYLENLNLCIIEEVDFTVEREATPIYIKSFSVSNQQAEALTLSSLRDDLLDTLRAMRAGSVENDYLHNLQVLTGLTWKQIDIFRGYRNYYFQIGSPFTKRRVAYALINNPQVSLSLFRYFEARFAPKPEWEQIAEREEQGLMPIRIDLASQLEAVADINEDQILRAFFNLIDSTVRTNFFIRVDDPDYFFSFKISAIGIIDMPAPRPLYEVYVHSATMEGIHLRGGKVARGGIRWSDRPDDFRTEVLGLMKTQMTKNSLIVPVGSKGGFVVKSPFATREEGAVLSEKAYRTLMGGLLDLTDNRVGKEVVTPDGIVTYDDPDSYLVVAADKGTAHLPDTANSVAADYGFWLDDAFASGGSYGYDHKKLGITARGAWVSVQRHFRELGVDVQKETFSVVGIGDMSGDVFGNGMLLSDRILLKAAFNHRHIFIDPNPDPDASFNERQRLFTLPRSGWDDYDAGLISEGGGVWERSSKSIPLSPQLREWLGVRHESLDGQTLIRTLLTAEIDLLWNGGIGTYVKATTETDEAVGDRANDAVRIDAPQLRAKVVGEGGNLGMTQLGRIEYALAGGRLNTDAIDNSAGVDCSDHEVNLKILMRELAKGGKIASQQERDELLESMTDEVCSDVLENNYSQSLCLSLDLLRSEADVEPFVGLLERLSRAGLLDRRSEFLPSSREIQMRSDKKLVRPELAIMLAYSKMHLYDILLESDLPEAAAGGQYLENYFPEAVHQRFGDELAKHPLVREIIATVMTNRIVDHAGSTCILDLVGQTGSQPETAAAAYLALEAALDAKTLRLGIFALDNVMPADRQYGLLLRVENCLKVLAEDCLVGGSACSHPAAIAELHDDILQFVSQLSGVLPGVDWKAIQAEIDELTGYGMAEATAQMLAALETLNDFLPVHQLVEQTGNDLFSVFRTYLDIREALDLDKLSAQIEAMQMPGRWDRVARHALVRRLRKTLFRLTNQVCQSADCNSNTFFSRHRSAMQRWKSMNQDVAATQPTNLHPFTVMVDLLEKIVEA